MRLPADVKLCNCAECGHEIIGESSKEWYKEQSPTVQDQLRCVEGHINGRPYCALCLKKKRIPGKKEWRGDPNPSRENAIRHLEGD